MKVTLLDQIELAVDGLVKAGVSYSNLTQLRSQIRDRLDSNRYSRGDILFEEALHVMGALLVLDAETSPASIFEQVASCFTEVLSEGFLSGEGLVKICSPREDMERALRNLTRLEQRIVKMERKAETYVRGVLATYRLG